MNKQYQTSPSQDKGMGDYQGTWQYMRNTGNREQETEMPSSRIVSFPSEGRIEEMVISDTGRK